MHKENKLKVWSAIFTIFAAIPTTLLGQIVTADEGKIEVHGFVSQAFLYTNQNNYLTMNTSSGSFDFTDGAINVIYHPTDKLRFGAQAYDEKIGVLGRGSVTLDWALADYKFKDWFGIRAGKVKTTLGLYNDIQDMDFLTNWALLPQSMYPVDLRETYIAHLGVDVYGSLDLKRFGTLAYTGYIGERPNDPTGGYAYGLAAYIPTIDLTSYTGRQFGGDVRWTTPINGLMLGASHLAANVHGTGLMYNWGFLGIPDGSPFKETTVRDFTDQFYIQYIKNKLEVDAEYRRYWRDHDLWFNGSTSPFEVPSDARSFYLAVSYHLLPRLTVGTYYSQYYADWHMGHDWHGPESYHGPGDPPDNHIFDWTISGRVDLTRHWNVKVEGHFMNGYGASDSIHGFYEPQNPNGFLPTTNLLIIRTGFNI